MMVSTLSDMFCLSYPNYLLLATMWIDNVWSNYRLLAAMWSM